MGYYIDTDNNGRYLGQLKSDAIAALPGVEELPSAPLKFMENLVCVVDNGLFEAAGYCFSEAEFIEFRRNDGRPKRWFIVPDAAGLSGYSSRNYVR